MNRAERRRLTKESRKKNVALPITHDELISNAVQQLQQGNLEQADKLFNKLISSNPDDPNALHFGGITKYQLGSYSKALELLTHATQVAPNYAEVHNSQGIVLLEQREFDKARQCFQHAIDLKSNYANAYTNLGSSLKGIGKLPEACAAYSNAISLDPNNREASYKLAATHLANNEANEALEAANNCLAIDPYCQNASAYKAIAFSQLQRHSEWNLLYNFDEMIHKFHIPVPKGYESLQSFNEHLEQDVRNHETLTWEPLERVTSGGAVTKDILLNPSNSILAFEKTLRSAIDKYRDNLVYNSEHVFYSRLPKKYRLTLIASILKENGKHPPHIHEDSWLSGVYYVSVPSAVNVSPDKREGWLEFGRPDYLVPDEFEPYVTAMKPEEGTALFFPSYYFHGTIPFTGSEERIGIAFDVYPAE
ncbi:MAG: tetratricopeptide repeat protein [Gammaproteobacteria bacterium]|nr:MAG: tetratricopeptide repeat protein [Gammaproteobacteria bacterium]